MKARNDHRGLDYDCHDRREHEQLADACVEEKWYVAK